MTERFHIISLSIHHIDFDESLLFVTALALQRQSSYICFANAHMVIEAYRNRIFSERVNNATLVLADGKPLAWSCRLLHHRLQVRISGMDFLPAMLEKANESRLSLFVYGSTHDVITAIKQKIGSNFPHIQFAGAISPPFKKLNKEELDSDIEKINLSGANLVLVALGCPKQENWMAENSGKINAVLLGIGGALPVVAGIQKRAPPWMQNMALEWFYRLMQQPKRLFSRYIYTNSYFLFLLCREWLKINFNKYAGQDK